MKQEKSPSKRIKTKLYMTLVCMVVALAVLGAAGYAWYTLSTNPEITGIQASVNGDTAIQVSLTNSKDSYTLSTALNVGDYAPLIPVSTVDGLNWFVCKYDVSGNVLQEADTTGGNYENTQFSYLRFPDGGNVAKTTSTVYKKENGNLSNQICSYYVYTDIYLKTDTTEADVYISLPSGTKTAEGYEAQETEKNHYGTYVLSYSYDEDDMLVTALSASSNTSVRVGIMPLGEVADGEDEDTPAEELKEEEDGVLNSPQYYYVTSNDVTEDDPLNSDVKKNSNAFIIYEPNADARSYVDKASDEYLTDKYISGFLAKTFKTATDQKTYGELEGYYLQTYPIRATTVTSTEIAKYLVKDTDTAAQKAAKIDLLKNGEDVDDGTGTNTTKKVRPIYDWLYTGQQIGTTGTYIDGIETTFDPEKLIVQKKSTWSVETLSQISVINSTNSTNSTNTTGGNTTVITDLKDLFNSTNVDVMGTFLKYDPEATAVTGYTSPVELKYVEAKAEGTHYANEDYTAISTADLDEDFRGSTKITTLYKDKPQKFRIYFWIEGQDVDCWNDIANSNFLVNLEFVGDIIVD